MTQSRKCHHHESLNDRLARLRRWCATGMLAAAELELHAWCRDRRCPAGAAVMLAKLMARRGQASAACDLLARYEKQHSHLNIGVLQELACLCWQLERHDEATHWIWQLYDQVGHVPSIQHWIQTMDATEAMNRSSWADPETEQLAVELMDHLSVVSSLVAALKLDPDEATIASLRAALSHAYRDIHATHEQVSACEALAELALLADDPRDARRWAHRGRRIDPFHVRFALVLAGIDDDSAVGPPASVALSEALRAYPHYPDVRAALIRREFADGQSTAARRRLQVWLNDQPGHPMALKLQQELAA